MNYTDFAIVCGLTNTGLTNGFPDPLQFGVPVRGGEVWEFSFYMTHKGADPNAQVIGSWATFDINGVSKGVWPDSTSYPGTGYKMDSIPPISDPIYPWSRFVMRHTIASGDGLTADPSGGVCGYIMACIWWHSTGGILKARYAMGMSLQRYPS